MNYLVRDRDVIFNLAGQVSHIDSMRDPYTDLEINCRSQLTVLEACRHHNPGVKVVFAGTRQVYGRPDSLPVTESHLVRPTDVNGINKAAGEYYHLVYNNVFGVRACSLRLTNVYGPRQLIKHNRQGFIGWFIRLAIEDRVIQIYGDGSQLRDFVYVDDAADAFLRAGADDACNGEVFNVGGEAPHSHRELTALLLDVAQSGRVQYVEWPADKRAIDIGSFYADSSKFTRDRVGAARLPARRPPANGGVLPPALRSLRRRRASTGDGVTRPRIPFAVLTPGEDADAVRRAIDRVVARGWFVLGPEVEQFEEQFAAASGAAHAVGVGNGTDALMLILRALGIGPGDEVITTPLSAAYTALAVMMAGARPVFADIDPVRFTIDPAAIAAAIGPRTRAILPVHLYGQAADMAAIERLASAHNLADRRGLLSGASGDGRRPSRRHHRRRRRLQLLSHEESRRARRRRRGRHERSGVGGARQADYATADRRAAMTTRSPASTHASTNCRPRSSVRGSRGCAAGPIDGAISRRATAPRWPAAGWAFPLSAMAGTCITCSSSERPNGRRCRPTSRQRESTRSCTTPSRFRNSRRWHRSLPRNAPWRHACAGKSCRCPCPRMHDDEVAAVAAAVVSAHI